jgi:hypothetical protein
MDGDSAPVMRPEEVFSQWCRCNLHCAFQILFSSCTLLVVSLYIPVEDLRLTARDNIKCTASIFEKFGLFVLKTHNVLHRRNQKVFKNRIGELETA